jgi:hypothetical protein
MKKSGTYLKIDHLNFGHVHGHDRIIMTSSKIQILFYHLLMTKMITYQYNILAKIGTISLDNIFKMVPSLQGGLFFLMFIF